MRIAWLALLLAGLVALPGTGHAQTANPANDALIAKGPTAIRDEFRAILQRARQSCSEVTGIFPAGQDPARTAYWDVACREGGRFRVVLRAERFTPPQVTACNAPGGTPGGPCFQPVGAAPAQVAAPAGGGTPQCRAACQSQPQALQGACLQRCASGGTVQAAAPGAAAAAMRGRFGFIYVGEPPATAFGFNAGGTDRLAASMNALRACETAIGRNMCRLALDFPNACGALAHALTTPPLQVRRLTTGTGQTVAQAEAEALRSCTLAIAPGSSISCRIAASGC